VKPLPIDERRIGKLADIVDAIEAEPRTRDQGIRLVAAYRALAEACDLALANAKKANGDDT
jgi:hypothetical protein